MFSEYPQAFSLFTYFCLLYQVNLMFKSLEVVKMGAYCSLKWALNSNQSHPSFLDTASPSCARIKMISHHSVLGQNHPFVLKQVSEIQQEFISASGLLTTLLLCCINWGQLPLCNEDEPCSSPIVIYFVLRVSWDKPGLPGLLQLLVFFFFVLYLFLLPLVLKGAAGKSPPAQRVPLQRGQEPLRGTKESTQGMAGGWQSLALVVHFISSKWVFVF